MKDKSGLWFWQRYAGIYDFLMGKDRLAYDRLGALIREEIHADSEVLELAAGTGLVARRVAGSYARYLASPCFV